ncbi:hypothetical protein EJG51_006705 [Undibacterium piscinae]|uniref:Uncharacterized protein n=1 Tax=Undibacterium piscinae TaxID=2495591 RepID=A0A6M4A2K7_9BURK|nr:hypothetical protein EJG51_006705 [Undibacterium piscinae]
MIVLCSNKLTEISLPSASYRYLSLPIATCACHPCRLDSRLLPNAYMGSMENQAPMAQVIAGNHYANQA